MKSIDFVLVSLLLTLNKGKKNAKVDDDSATKLTSMKNVEGKALV